jgi:hypothetical protein
MSGLVPPLFALVYAQIFSVRSITNLINFLRFQVFSEPVEKLAPDARLWSFMFVAIGLFSALGFFISVRLFDNSLM